MSVFANGRMLVDTIPGAVALYTFCNDWHSGGGSRGYRLLCRIGKRLKLNSMWMGYEGLEEYEKEIYDELERKYAGKI